MGRWTFTGLELISLWKMLDTETMLPSPLIYITDIKSRAEYERQQRLTLERVLPSLDPKAIAALRVLLGPDLMVLAWGSAKPLAPDTIRIVGARAGNNGCVVQQLPGESYGRPSGYVVTDCNALDLADEVVKALPDTKPGQSPDLPLPPEKKPTGTGHDDGYWRSPSTETIDGRSTTGGEEFLAKPTTRRGGVRVVQSRSVFGPRGLTQSEFQWRDVENDGRYAIRPGSPRFAIGVDGKRMRDLINTHIAVIVQHIKDERLR